MAITQVKSKLPTGDCQEIVRLVRKVREVKSNKLTPTVRACVMIGKLLSMTDRATLNGNYRKICMDILLPEVPKYERHMVQQIIDDEILCFAHKPFFQSERAAESDWIRHLGENSFWNLKMSRYIRLRRNMDKEQRKTKSKPTEDVEIDFGAGKIGFGGIFKGLGNLIELASKMNEEGVTKSGEIKGLPKEMKGVLRLQNQHLKRWKTHH